MKLFVKLMLALLVIGLLLPFTLLKDDSGKPLASFSDFGLPDFSLPSLPRFSSGGSSTPVPDSDDNLDGKVLFYKWYDADGDVQFTSEPPAEGVEYTVKGFDPDANVIQAVKLPAGDSADGESSSAAGKSATDIGNPYSKETIEKLFEDAKNVEKLLQERLQQQEATFNQ